MSGEAGNQPHSSIERSAEEKPTPRRACAERLGVGCWVLCMFWELTVTRVFTTFPILPRTYSNSRAAVAPGSRALPTLCEFIHKCVAVSKYPVHSACTGRLVLDLPPFLHVTTSNNSRSSPFFIAGCVNGSLCVQILRVRYETPSEWRGLIKAQQETLRVENFNPQVIADAYKRGAEAGNKPRLVVQVRQA